jgi:hypothetical protein
MSKLTHVLINPDVRRAIEAQAPRAEILAHLRDAEAGMAQAGAEPGPSRSSSADDSHGPGRSRRSALGTAWIALVGLLQSMNEFLLESEMPSWI